MNDSTAERPLGTPGAPARALAAPTGLPLLYFAFAHLSLLTALAVIAVDPRGVSGFFYHPRMLGVVHLVTLGWITGSILGAIRVVGPLVLQVPIPVTRGDYGACACVVIGTSGLVSHFWLETYSGMAWSAAMVWLGLLHPALRVIGRLRAVARGGAVGLHLGLACVNLLLAGALGVLLGVDKVTDVVPGNTMSNVYAHAHLAAGGWASMMVVGVGYRLLPMVIPSPLPRGRGLYGSAILLEIGLVGLVVTLVTGWPGTALSALSVATGLVVFLSRVVWMTAHRRTPAAALARPDVAAAQAGLALLYLVLTTSCGLVLAASGTAVWTVPLMMLYGVFGLLGFLGQLVVAMELRVLPLLAWYGAARGGRVIPAWSTHQLPAQGLAVLAFGGWLVGLPLLAAGLALDRPPLVAAGAWVLLVAVALNTAHAVWMLRPLVSGAGQASRSAMNRPIA